MRRFLAIGCTLTCIVGLLAAAPARAVQLDLRVLVIAVGTSSVDPGRAAVEKLLTTLGVPYETLDASRQDLTQTMLVSGARGRFNGIILTQSETYVPGSGPGFTGAEFAMLQNYERTFGVREAVLSGFPATNPGLSLDYGMATVTAGSDMSARFQAPAGGTEIFEYVNTSNPLPTQGFAFKAVPRNVAGGPIVEPLLVDAAAPQYALISRITYPDGRKVLLSTLNNATFFMHTQVLAYEFLNFATSGLFLGARRVYLAIHNDDLFLPDDVWDPATETNFPEEVRSFRLSAAEVSSLVSAQRQFRTRHPLASRVAIELAFNGVGANLAADPLTQAIRANRFQLAFINHTYSALQMDRLCPDDELGPGPSACPRTNYATAYSEINQNAQVWSSLGFPNAQFSRTAVLTDSHSGLSDRMGTVDTGDDVPFPAGFNPELGRACTALGVRMLAGDASRTNQDRIQRVPGFSISLLPRYPTAVFYNTTTPDELTSEYNYIFYYSYLDRGIDPCSVPGAICSPRSYEQILSAEADAALRHILSYDPFPHYFHQSNLHTYDASLRTLQFDWLERVVTAYEQVFKLPIESPRFHELADLTWRIINARAAQPSGFVETATGVVSLRANTGVNVDVTGLAQGTLYGGQRIRNVRIGPTPTTYLVDPALSS